MVKLDDWTLRNAADTLAAAERIKADGKMMKALHTKANQDQKLIAKLTGKPLIKRK